MNKFNEITQSVLQEEKDSWSKLQEFLKSKGIETADLFIVQNYITEIVNETFKSNRTKNSFNEQ